MEGNLLRIREREYEKYQEIAKLVLEKMKNDENSLLSNVVPWKNVFPKKEDIEKEDVLLNLKEYLPYLVFYKDIYESDLDGVSEMKETLNKIFLEWVDVLPDVYYKKIDKITGSLWRRSSLENRAKWFDDVISCYGFNEFNEFVNDLDYYVFMRGYGIRQLEFVKGQFPSEMINDLREVWNYLQK